MLSVLTLITLTDNTLETVGACILFFYIWIVTSFIRSLLVLRQAFLCSCSQAVPLLHYNHNNVINIVKDAYLFQSN